MSDNHYSSINWSELYGGKPITIVAYEPDPDSFHENFYYNSTQNRLYRLTKIRDCNNNITKKSWKSVNKPAC